MERQKFPEIFYTRKRVYIGKTAVNIKETVSSQPTVQTKQQASLQVYNRESIANKPFVADWIRKNRSSFV